MFSDQETLAKWLELAAKMRSAAQPPRDGSHPTSPLPVHTTCLLCLACLFSTDYAMFLDDPDTIADHLADVYIFCDWANEV